MIFPFSIIKVKSEELRVRNSMLSRSCLESILILVGSLSLMLSLMLYIYKIISGLVMFYILLGSALFALFVLLLFMLIDRKFWVVFDRINKRIVFSDKRTLLFNDLIAIAISRDSATFEHQTCYYWEIILITKKIDVDEAKYYKDFLKKIKENIQDNAKAERILKNLSHIQKYLDREKIILSSIAYEKAVRKASKQIANMLKIPLIDLKAVFLGEKNFY